MVSGAIHAWSFPDARQDRKGAGPKMSATTKGGKQVVIYGGFLKLVGGTQQPCGFPTKDDHFGGVLRVPPFEETPIYNPFIKKTFFFLGKNVALGKSHLCQLKVVKRLAFV